MFCLKFSRFGGFYISPYFWKHVWIISIIQLQGTAMVTVFAPTYANLTIGYHEIKLYDIIELNYNLYFGLLGYTSWQTGKDS